MNKEIKTDGYISVSKIYGNNDDNVLNIRIEPSEIDSSVGLDIKISYDNLMRALTGVMEQPCDITWKNLSYVGFKRVTKIVDVKDGEIDKFLVDGWNIIHGYRNGHYQFIKDGETHYKVSLCRYEKEL